MDFIDSEGLRRGGALFRPANVQSRLIYDRVRRFRDPLKASGRALPGLRRTFSRAADYDSRKGLTLADGWNM